MKVFYIIINLILIISIGFYFSFKDRSSTRILVSQTFDKEGNVLSQVYEGGLIIEKDKKYQELFYAQYLNLFAKVILFSSIISFVISMFLCSIYGMKWYYLFIGIIDILLIILCCIVWYGSGFYNG